MRKSPFCGLIGWVLCAILSGCMQMGPETATQALPPDTLDTGIPTAYCGKAELVNVSDADGRSLGDFEMRNDARFLWVTFSPNGQLNGLSLYVGDPQECPRQVDGSPAPGRYPIQFPDLHQPKPWSARIPLDQLNACTFAAGRFQVSQESREMIGELQAGAGDSISQGMKYCIQSCQNTIAECDISDPVTAPRTIPQSEWAQKENNGLRKLLQEKFGMLYPDGLALGCNFQIRFPTASDVLAHFPMLGEPAALKSNAIANGADHLDNRLLGELLALELAMKIDATMEEFSPGEASLSALQLAKGAFEGWTLTELVQEGNGVLGGCTSNYQPAQIVEVLQTINSNFVKGLPQGDYLRCPTI